MTVNAELTTLGRETYSLSFIERRYTEAISSCIYGAALWFNAYAPGPCVCCQQYTELDLRDPDDIR